MVRGLKSFAVMASTKTKRPHFFTSLFRRLLPVSAAVVVTLTFGTADAWAKANAAPVAGSTPPVETAETTLARLAAELPFAGQVPMDDAFVEYAQREARNLGLENFHGGDVVIIGSTGLIIVLLIILILVLV